MPSTTKRVGMENVRRNTLSIERQVPYILFHVHKLRRANCKQSSDHQAWEGHGQQGGKERFFD